MVIAVSDLDGTLIALYRMTDATVFSIDVAATKARNMIYFNSAARVLADLAGVPVGTAVTNRTIGFGAQPFFPPGIDGTAAGPFFALYTNDVANPCTQGSQPAGRKPKRHRIFSRAVKEFTSMASSSAASASAATASTRTISLRTAAMLASSLPHPCAPTKSS